MKNVNITVMGKTGAGKSTLINAVLGEDVAPTGIGQAITKENTTYSRRMFVSLESDNEPNEYRKIMCRVNMHDTVGLEIDPKITKRTLNEIEKHISDTKACDNIENGDDIHLVWFCVNVQCSRIEEYEVELIRELSIKHEIPFIIVLTKCYPGMESGLEERVKEIIPEVPRKRVLAREAVLGGGIRFLPYGVSKLLGFSVSDYESLKVNILEEKMDWLDEEYENRLENIKQFGYECIIKYAESAKNAGKVPAVCIPFVHGKCIKMIAELNEIAGFPKEEAFADEIFSNVIVGIIASPFMVIPFLSMAVAYAYVETVGEYYLEALLGVIHCSSYKEIQDYSLMKMRIKEELSNYSKNA